MADHVAYVSRGTGVHDRRVLAALRAGFPHVTHFHRAESQEHHNPGTSDEGRPVSLAELPEVLAEQCLDLVVAGPLLPEAAAAFAADTTAARVALSWGFDILGPDVDAAQLGDVVRRSDLLVIDSQASLDVLATHDIEPPAVCRIAYGITAGDFPEPTPTQRADARRALGIADDAHVLVTTRGWTRLHGTERVVRSFATEAPASERPWHLVVLGAGPRATEVRSLVAALSPRAPATLVEGPVEPAVVRQALWASDYYASLAAVDGTSVSVLEAMSTGLPVLLADIPSNRHLLDDVSGAGRLVDLDQPMLGLDELPSVGTPAHAAMVGAAVAGARRVGDWPSHAKRLVDACRRAANHRRGS